MTTVPTTTGPARPSVLFVCVKNGGKSQMAAGLMNLRAAGAVEVQSAGTKPGTTINELSAESLAELGVDITGEKPKPITDDAVRVLVSGAIPDDLSEDEKIAAELTRQLSTTHRVDETLYRQAEHCFGTKGLTDIAILIGIYHTVCTTLNLFEIPAPHE